MRWKIETKKGGIATKDEKGLDGQTYKNTYENSITTKTLYISVGDIVGMGKTAAGAVQKLSKQLPVFINKIKGLAASAKDAAKGTGSAAQTAAANAGKAAIAEATATAINYMVQPLTVILNGVEGYRKVMNIVDRLTPIMKAIARTTGVWCSPGNVAELAQMAAGKANQILMALLSTSIVKLKDFIWNYEFDIYSIPSDTSILISQKLKEYNEANQELGISTDTYTRGIHIEDDKDGEVYENKNEDINKLINEMFPKEYEAIKPDSDLLLGMLKGRSLDDSKKGKYNYNSNNYITEYIAPESTKRRMLFGSLDNKGIYYSDDDGLTWKQSHQTDKSFARFCKILKPDGKYRYVAGSTYPVKEIKPLEETEIIERDNYNRYLKDYYSSDMERLNRKQKDFILNNNKLEDIISNGLFNNSKEIEKDNAFGIYYSDDDGLTWSQSEIKVGRFELFFEYEEKECTPDNIPNRLVASSYDYEGVYYSDDGINWERSILLKGDKTELIETGRWIFYTDSDDELSNKVSPNKLKAEGGVSSATASSIVATSGHSLSTMHSKCASNITISQYDLKDLEYLRSIVFPIIKYIHDNYSERLAFYSEKWWLKKIELIINEEYTLEDAKNGKDLEGDIK